MIDREELERLHEAATHEAGVERLRAQDQMGIGRREEAKHMLAVVRDLIAERDILAAENAALTEKVERLEGALIPSGETKAAYMSDIRIVSLTRKRFIVGQVDRERIIRECNYLLRGMRPPQRCTCTTDHGWH